MNQWAKLTQMCIISNLYNAQSIFCTLFTRPGQKCARCIVKIFVQCVFWTMCKVYFAQSARDPSESVQCVFCTMWLCKVYFARSARDPCPLNSNHLKWLHRVTSGTRRCRTWGRQTARRHNPMKDMWIQCKMNQDLVVININIAVYRQKHNFGYIWADFSCHLIKWKAS